LGAVPGLALVEPSCEAEVGPLLAWGLRGTPGSAYIRLVTFACDALFALPAGYRVEEGRRVALTGPDDAEAVLIGYGPLLLGEACRAAKLLEGQGIALRIVNLPFLNRVDRAWLEAELGPRRFVFTLDNHYLAGGQGE